MSPATLSSHSSFSGPSILSPPPLFFFFQHTFWGMLVVLMTVCQICISSPDFFLKILSHMPEAYWASLLRRSTDNLTSDQNWAHFFSFFFCWGTLPIPDTQLERHSILLSSSPTTNGSQNLISWLVPVSFLFLEYVLSYFPSHHPGSALQWLSHGLKNVYVYNMKLTV